MSTTTIWINNCQTENAKTSVSGVLGPLNKTVHWDIPWAPILLYVTQLGFLNLIWNQWSQLSKTKSMDISTSSIVFTLYIRQRYGMISFMITGLKYPSLDCRNTLCQTNHLINMENPYQTSSAGKGSLNWYCYAWAGHPASNSTGKCQKLSGYGGSASL